jgi:hypothetical protein
MVLKRILTVCITVLLSHLAGAQTWPFEVWHEGRIVLLEGDTLRGLIKYDLHKDLVEFTIQDRKVEAFTARKVVFFEIFDESVKKYRQFYALPFSTAGGYKAPIFFELLEEGKMTLLAREFLENRTYTSPYYTGSYNRVVLSYKYFFLDDEGDIAEFVGNKNDLLDMMGKNGDDVEKYIRSNRLRVDDKYDFAKIIAYYNSLSGG